MKQVLDRVKNDVATIEKAMGLAPALHLEWVPWMKRDKWLNLWWALPGLILLGSAFLPAGIDEKLFGLAPAQWIGVVTAISMLGLLIASIWKMTANDGRPESLIREYKKCWGIDNHGQKVSLALLLEFFLFIFWAVKFRLSPQAFFSGIFIIVGATYLVLTVVSRLWLLFGVAIPILAYGLFEALLAGHGPIKGVPLGLMFIGIGLFCFSIQAWQIRQIERQDESH